MWRVVGSGLCKLRELSDGTYNIREYLDMVEFLNLQDYVSWQLEKKQDKPQDIGGT